MLKFTYYIVYTTVVHENSNYPVFYTCVKTSSGYVVITDLKEYLKDGKSGLSENIIPLEAGFVLINDLQWKSRVNNQTFFK